MNKIDLGQTITILANLGVIAGIVFLALELRQNSDLLSMQARETLQAAKMAEQLHVTGNTGGVLEAILKADSGEPLTELERAQVGIMRNLSLYNYAWQYQEVLSGRLTESDMPVRQWASVFRSPSMQELWRNAKDSFDPRFVQYIEETIIPYEF